MNGAACLVQTLLNGGIDLCLANPGTSEMHFVAALDAHPDMRCVLGLHETVVSGAADGYGRMADKPAATLLHLGSGLSNASANMHNARRARTPMVNVVGDHATYHRQYNAPLTSDIEGLARPVSDWVRTIAAPDDVPEATAEAIRAASAAPGQIATLILPADTSWGAVSAQPATVMPPAAPPKPDQAAIDQAVKLLTADGPALLLVGDRALRADGLALAARIRAATGADLATPMSNKRVERGAGRPSLPRVPYPVDQALAMLSGYRAAVLVGAKDPVAFFAYPGKPSRFLPEDCEIFTLAAPSDDQIYALEALVDALGAGPAAPDGAAEVPAAPTGALNGDSIGQAVGALLPEGAIVADESITTGRQFFPLTAGAPPHDWLQITGGAIGCGMPLATGAALACPDRPVLNLQADGSALYSAQSLWTQAREGLNVTTVIFANRSYQILLGEMKGVGVENPGPSARDMLNLDRPAIDWVSLARGFGVEAAQATTADELVEQLSRGFQSDGPYLIEAVLA